MPPLPVSQNMSRKTTFSKDLAKPCGVAETSISWKWDEMSIPYHCTYPYVYELTNMMLCLWPWYSTQAFVSAVCLSVWNSIPKKAVKFPCLNCAFASFAAAKASSSAISWCGAFRDQILHLNDLVDSTTLSDRSFREIHYYYILISTYGIALQQLFLLKTTWGMQHSPVKPTIKPCLLGLRHLFIRYLHQEGTSDLTPSLYYQLQALPWRIGWRSSPTLCQPGCTNNKRAHTTKAYQKGSRLNLEVIKLLLGSPTVANRITGRKFFTLGKAGPANLSANSGGWFQLWQSTHVVPHQCCHTSETCDIQKYNIYI